MFSVNNFYDYLTHKYSHVDESYQNLVFMFSKHGSKNIDELVYHLDNNIFNQYIKNIERYFGTLTLIDQEPIFFNGLNCDIIHPNISKFLSVPEKVMKRLSRMRTPIICHSEKNSDEVSTFLNNGFLEAHYWYHALIARDWFRHWKYYRRTQIYPEKRFGIYCRDHTGTREYRKQLMIELSKIYNNVYWNRHTNFDYIIDNNPWYKSEMIYDSDSSAKIVWDDQKKFQIHIVAETLFETNKIHLTEKIFKPIVMEQPFILFGPSGSLNYLKNYGFKTFDEVWNESYDGIQNHQERFFKIIELINTLNSLNDEEFKNIMNRCHQITEYNRKWFYSEAFEEQLLYELHNNISTAITQQDEIFLKDPGGTYFKFVDRLQQKSGQITSKDTSMIINLISYMNQNFPKQAKILKNDYGHLF